LLCLTSPAIEAEFERYRLPRLRVLTGWLEIAGASGLTASYWVPELLAPAAGGLALLMAFALAARVRVRDSLVQMAPALALLVSNGFLVVTTLDAGRGAATPPAASEAGSGALEEP
jgi:hypothetical protein